MIASSEAIVLKSFDYRETSRIVTFFTKNYGKISGIMKGVRKDPKKFGSSVDKFSSNDIVYYRYSRSDLHLISQCDMTQFYFPIREDYKRNLAANYVMELVDVVMQVEQVNEKIYQLIEDFLKSLEDVRDINKLVYMFQIKILALSGFSPHLDSCVKCSKKVEGRVRFSMQSGGLVCQACPTQESTLTFISRGSISSMIHIEDKDWRQCMRLGLTAAVQKELKFILNNFLIYHFERTVRAQKFLHAS